MAVVTKYATGYQDPAVKPVNALPVEEVRGTLRHLVSVVNIANGDSATSKNFFGKLPSNARISKTSRLDCEAITGCTSYDLGGTNLVNGLMAAQTLAVAATKDPIGAIAVGNLNKPLWAALGYAADPGGELDIFGTMNQAATATGNVALTLEYSLP